MAEAVAIMTGATAAELDQAMSTDPPTTDGRDL
jgi:hypothetical protein